MGESFDDKLGRLHGAFKAFLTELTIVLNHLNQSKVETGSGADKPADPAQPGTEGQSVEGKGDTSAQA